MRAAGLSWARRAAFEREAEARFATLAADLHDVGAPAALVDLAAKAARDEARHRALCASLAERFGATVDPVAVAAPAPIAPAGLDARSTVLYEAVALCAVMETVSTVLLGEMLRRTTDPDCRSTVHAVLADEVDHARIGWGLLAFEATRGDLCFLAPLVPAMFRGTVTEELFDPPELDRHGAALEPFGGLRRAARRQAFEDAVREVVLPGLRAYGVDATPALRWLDGH